MTSGTLRAITYPSSYALVVVVDVSPGVGGRARPDQAQQTVTDKRRVHQLGGGQRPEINCK